MSGVKNWKLLIENIRIFNNMLELHQIRIKIKRFRYALQTLPEVPRDSNLLRRLKRLQDMLGVFT